MKILLVHNAYQQRGGEDIVFEQEKQLLSSRGHTVLTYLRSNNEINKASSLQKISLVKRAVWAEDARDDVLQLLEAERPDIAHVHNTFMMISPSVYSAFREAGVAVVQTLHNYRLLCPAATFFRDGAICEECVEHSLIRGASHGCYHNSRLQTAAVSLTLKVHRLRSTWTMVDSFIALSGFARNKFIESGLPAQKVKIKPNFVDPDPKERTETGEYALFVGRLSPEKGLITMIDAWRRLHYPVPLRIVGDGPMRAQLELESAKVPHSNIKFEGAIPRESVFEAIKRARFLILPSEWYECFPMTLVEAFACGTPCIASAIGSLEEIVEDGRNGLLFEPRNAQDLADKVEQAWSSPEMTRQMGREARKSFENIYTAEQNYVRLMDIYSETLAGRQKEYAAELPIMLKDTQASILTNHSRKVMSDVDF
jgi:glycosyltransferase involved in cell wall biosynthesis